MANLIYYESTVQNLWKAFFQAGNAEQSDFFRWKETASNAADSLNIFMQGRELNNAERRRCQTCVSHLYSLQIRFKNLLKIGGHIEVANEQQADQLLEAGVIWRDINSAFKNRINTGIIINKKHLNIRSFLEESYNLFVIKIKNSLKQHGSLKVNTEMSAQYFIEKDGEENIQIKYFNTPNSAIYSTTDLESWFATYVHDIILKSMDDFSEERESGWTLKTIIGLTININKHNPIKASSWIDLPEYIANKKACINVQNHDDDECFKWAVLSCIHPAKSHGEDVTKYSVYAKELKFDGITFPVHPKDVGKFENLNDISINVYILNKKGNKFEISPCHVTKMKRDPHVNLLLIQNHYIDEDDSMETEPQMDKNFKLKFHYVWIKNMSALIRSQVKKNTKKIHFCDRCLHYFTDKDKLKTHIEDCSKLNSCRIKLPENNILNFKNYDHRELVPYVIYADFECLLKPVEDIRVFQEHEAFSIGFYVKCSFDVKRSFFKSYRKMSETDQSPSKWMIQQLKMLVADLEEIYKNAVEMKLTDLEEETFQKATTCHMCKKSFQDHDNRRVRDHCHLTGRFRGAAHNSCNLNYRNSSFIPIIFHNLTGYDSHLIIKEMGTDVDLPGKITLLAENKERYISFTKHVADSRIKFRFLDSVRFAPASLEELASYLDKTDIVEEEIGKDYYTCEQIQLLKRKGVFPYEYVSSLKTLAETHLPSLENFHSQLTNSDISNDDYEHAKTIWETFNIKNLGEYSDLYLKTDVLLLADVFGSFRAACIEAYSLDPAHYHTTPSLTWDAMLQYTKANLELLTDIDMVLFIEKGIRGGVSQCSNRYSKANNKYMKEGYDETKPSKTILYLDENNMYGWAMEQYLPYNNIEWVDEKIIDEKQDFFNVPDDNKEGYILEVDLKYPKDIHDAHKDFPFCPEHLTPPGSKQKKLLTTLYDKKRYVIHYRALKQALKYGLKLEKIHRALKFIQSPWLKPYVQLNTEKRKNAKNEFEKLFFKLMINAVYGKTVENERKRKDVKLVSSWDGRYGASARIAQPNFHSSSIFNENLVAIQLSRTTINIRKPIYIGLSVLDLSKTLIYDFHYGYMKFNFGDDCLLLYTDTDSGLYEMKYVDMYKRI